MDSKRPENDLDALLDEQRQLREDLVARDELVLLAAHELRSPLGVLHLVAERLVRTEVGLAHDELRRLGQTALRQTRRLHLLISNLLDVSRLRAGKFELELERVSLGDLVRDASEPLKEQARQEGTSLDVRIETEGTGAWDRVRMEQIVINLVVNAIKYGGKSPVDVVLREAGPGEVELCVSDCGPGIPEEHQAGVFEAFVRATRRHNAQSLGLGLFIVQEIVQAHGGRLVLSSKPGETRFSIFLPLR